MQTLQGQYGVLEGSGIGKNPTNEPFFEIYTSFLEIYNEEIIDLLAPTESNNFGPSGTKKKKHTTFSIREDAKGEIYLTGIREEKIVSGDEIFALLQKGSLSRTTKSTEMNMVSSRSHAIFTLLLRQRKEDGGKILTSKLHFVDLAGSERLKRTQAQVDRVKESISINSGLLALGNVISALGDPHKRSTHIPYRNSKLTRLLQDSLGGNSQTLMIACASPSSDNFVESLNTLKYADRAKNIQNSVKLNEELGGNGAFEVAQLKKQIASLKQEILHLRTSRRSETSDLDNSNSSDSMKMSSAVASKSHVIDQAEMTRLRVQNSELKRRINQMSKERATIETERDAFKAAAGPKAYAAQNNVKAIAELKGRIAELESANSLRENTLTSAKSSVVNNAPNAPGPQTPVWLRQANVLVNKARDEIRDNLQTMRKIEFDNTQITNPAASTSQMGMASVAATAIMDDDEPMTPSKSNVSHGSLLMQPIPFSLSHNSLSNPQVLQLTQAQFSAAVSTRCESLMNRVRSDLSLKEDLIRQFEICQAEYSSMRRNYDEKMRLVHENLMQAQKERDLAIKKVTASHPIISQPTISISNRRYEERIKTLGKELNAARAATSEAQKAIQSRMSASDSSMKSLRSQLETMRVEKSKLTTRLAEETNRLKNDCFAHDSELTELRQREYRATESARKLKKAYEFQKALLQKRIEQNHQARNKIRQLLLALKKLRTGGITAGFLEDDLYVSDFMMMSDGVDSGESIGNESIENVEQSDQAEQADLPPSQQSQLVTRSYSLASVSPDAVSEDDDEILLQLNAQTEAVLNDDITMMEIDSPEAAENPEDKQGKSTSMMFPRTIDDAQTGEMPRSALRHSPLVSRRRDVFAKLEENKKNPFK